MPEYIEREAVLVKLREAVQHKGMGAAIAGILIRYIEKIPAADVAPVVHGRWVNRFNASVYECSECGTIGLPCWKGCPECLAKMDGDGNG